MKIPSSVEERDVFYDEIIRKCTVSQENRMNEYATLRHYYLFGRAPEDQDCPYNKIFPHIDALAAFLFASETTKFSIQLGQSVPENEFLRVPILNKLVNDAWLYSNADHVTGQVVTWSLVYNTMLTKLIVRNKTVEPFPIDPGMFGVLREDLPYNDRQEAMVHSYYTTYSQLENDLDSHPQKDHILAHVSASPRPTQDQPSGVERIIMAATTPNVVGNAPVNFNSHIEYRPKVDEPLIKMHELWIWNDEINDYQVVTRTDNGLTIFDRKNFFLKGEHPFIQFCPNPIYSYYWGLSEVAGLTQLQSWRNDRTYQIRKLLDLQASPPTAITGFTGIPDEKAFFANMPESYIYSDSMQAKVEKFSPTIPTDIWSTIREIDEMFHEKSGLPNIVMGKGEVGVRSGRQTSELARYASARIRRRALVIEDALEKMATLYLKVMKKYDDRTLRDSEGNEFSLDQFTDDFVVKVDAHSNSPLFTEDQRGLAVELLQAKAIDREEFLEMMNPPDKEILKRKLKVMMAAEQKAQQQQMAAQQQEK